MKTSSNNRKKHLLALCLSLMMLSSTAALASCSKSSATDSSSSSSSSSSATEEVNDTLLVKNGGFETFNTNDGLNAIGTSVSNWSRSVNTVSTGSALTSKAASGIINTSADEWNKLTGTALTDAEDITVFTEADAEAKWSTLTTRDKLAYYDAWKVANPDGDIKKDLSFYQSFNIDSGDIPTPSCNNPGTHDNSTENTKILMIHNEYPENTSTSTYKSLGTAQKYTASTAVTVKAGTAAEFSVWVKTSDLMSTSTDGTPQSAVKKGAYISITHSVGGKQMDAYEVKNINTENMAESSLSNGWKQYSFYLKGSSFADTTFSVVLGLGQGGGTDRLEYVNGYAFFDDIQCNLITNEAFDDKMTELNLDEKYVADFNSTKKDKKTIDVSTSEHAASDTYAMNFYGKFLDSSILSGSFDYKATSSKVGGVEYTSMAGNSTAPWLGEGFVGTNDEKAVYTSAADMVTAAAGKPYLSAVYQDFFKDNEFSKDKPVLLLLSADGVAYTAESQYQFSFKDANNNPVDYVAVSFFVKTSDLNGLTGAGIKIVDKKNETTAFTSIDTTDITTVDVGEQKDIYDGWQQCFFFVENDSENPDATFTLTFNFGPTAITKDTTTASFGPGFAAFTDFTTYAMSKKEFESVQSNTYSLVVTVKGDNVEEETGNAGFDTASSVAYTSIEDGITTLKNYKGVYSDSDYVTVGDGTNTKINQNPNAGLINKEHFLEYYDTLVASADAPAWIKGLQAAYSGTPIDAEDVWDTVIGDDVTQPLLIWNDGTSNKAYGYIGTTTTIAANSYVAISTRVKVSAGAKAYVYLMDMDDDLHQKKLSIGSSLVYWYDNDGNVCASDPTASGFNKRTDVAFKLQSNGLYQVNKNWKGASSELISATAYYANLDAYTETDDDGNKLVGEGGVTYAYTNAWNGEGQDGVAFYYDKDSDTYFADKAKTIPVRNLKDVTKINETDTVNPLPYRYLAQAEKELYFEIGNTYNDWATVTFYVHTGDTAKNYRLEVWSGERNGVANNADTYVMFDTNNPGEAETNFTGLIEEYKDKADATYFESVFSFYDTDKYLRYNADFDKANNQIGNDYEKSFIATEQTAGVAYLTYKTDLSYNTFADFSYSEKMVTPMADDDSTTDDETDDDTDDGMNIWLLASSVAIAGVLLLAIVSLIVRKIVVKIRRKRGYYARTAEKPAKKSKKK
ncbi:MAG: hypothetical protein IKA88_02420 [Clostridia bacterium]|nr:hypothetical protein [Clostridia bacterium]